MREPTIALAFTPEPWVESLHRHFTDHGGARVRQLVMDPGVALDDDYEILVSSARWPGLTPGLVAELHDRHRRVLGVATREDRGSLDLLQRAGVDRVVMADAAPVEFLAALLLLAPDADPLRPTTPDVPAASAARRVVVRGPVGTGATEVAIALAARAAREAAVVLIDLDEVAPSIAQRLGLPIEPNLRTAIDVVEYGVGEPDALGGDAAFRVVPGIPNPAAWAQVRPTEVDRVVRAMGRDRDLIVLDVAAPLDEIGGAPRGRYAIARSVLADADAVVAVGLADPVGLTRLVHWLADAHHLLGDAPVHVVLNRAPKDAYRCRELAAELERCYSGASLTFVPDDDLVTRARWDGAPVPRGAFSRAVDQLVPLVAA